MRVLENNFDRAKLNVSVYKSTLDCVATFVVSAPGVECMTGADGAVEAPVLSAKQFFESVACLIWESVSSSDCDMIKTVWKERAIRLKIEECLCN